MGLGIRIWHSLLFSGMDITNLAKEREPGIDPRIVTPYSSRGWGWGLGYPREGGVEA